MDARSLAAAAGVNIGTLNVWVQRGLVPGMTIGAKGRERDFDRTTATGVLLLAELVRFGIPAPMASQIVTFARHATAKWLLITQRPNSAGKEAVHITHCESIDTISVIHTHRKQQELPSPTVFMLIDLEAIAERLRRYCCGGVP